VFMAVGDQLDGGCDCLTPFISAHYGQLVLRRRRSRMLARGGPHAVAVDAARDAFDRSWPPISSVKGWFAKEEAALLHAAAGEVSPGGWIVEVGSAFGRSTSALAFGKPSTARILAVDPFAEPPNGGGDVACHQFLQNIDRLGLSDDVALFRGTSEQAARHSALLFGAIAGRPGLAVATPRLPERPVELLFIDGRHDRNSVLLDIDCWEPLVADGGRVVFHDAFFRLGTTLAILQRHLANSWFRYEGSVCNASVFRRESVVPNRTMIGDSVRLTGRLGHLAHNFAITVGVRSDSPLLKRLFPASDDYEY
jgi:hypothetical protein